MHNTRFLPATKNAAAAFHASTKRILAAVVCMSVCGLYLPQAPAAMPAEAPEYQLKAVYLYHLAKFITWPAAMFDNAQSPFHLCILGKDPFKPYLEITVANTTLRGRPIRLSYLKGASDNGRCHLLFISTSETGSVEKHLKHFSKQPILTVSDIEDFVRRGGMVRFYKDKQKIRMRICPQALESAELRADANLLRLSDRFCP